MKSGTKKMITTAIILIVFALVTGAIVLGITGGTQSVEGKNSASDAENVNKLGWHETFGTGHDFSFMSVMIY